MTKLLFACTEDSKAPYPSYVNFVRNKDHLIIMVRERGSHYPSTITLNGDQADRLLMALMPFIKVMDD